MWDDEVRRQIEQKNRLIERAVATGRMDEFGDVFAEDVWQMPPNTSPLVGRDAVIAFWSQAVTAGSWRFELQTQDVVVSAPIAVERGKYRLTYAAGPNAPPEMPSFEDHGNYVVLWRRDDDGEWRILWDAPVSEQPLPH